MNNGHIIAWMDDLQMSAHLAKISTMHSYEMQFCDTIAQLSEISYPYALIIDLDNTSEDKLQRIVSATHNHHVALIGYCQGLKGSHLKYFKELRCKMVFKRYNLMQNLDSILDKIFNES